MTTSSVFEKWFPVTSDFGLIDAPLESISELYQSWWTDIGKEVSVKVSTGILDEQFNALLPLTIGLNRALILPTISNWTAFFRNGIQGSDPSSAMPVLAKQLNARTMRVCIAREPQKYPAVIWEVYEPTIICGERAGTRRSIAAANDGGNWVFETSGRPYAFEKTNRYTLTRKRDRFDRDMLTEYISHFGVPCIGDALFQTDALLEGRLISFPNWENAKNFTLEEVTARVPWER
tara:strand:- start:332 stop:1033 length:702 start_codon:yes stop_codon:yes gene_type:complete